jgi:hypothetical protein
MYIYNMPAWRWPRRRTARAHDDARGALGAGRVFIYAYYALAAGLVMSVGRPTDRLGSPTSLLLRGVTIGDDA